MSKLFQNKYRISSARLQTWNYGNEGMYFITICTKNRQNYFGEIMVVETLFTAALPPIKQQMELSEIGKIAEMEWYKTIELRPDMNLELGEFQIMPNHIHGIIIINENQLNTERGRGCRVAQQGVSTTANKFGSQSKNIASIIRGYKSAVTTYARKNHIAFDWQPRFHDHIICSMDEYHRISIYILNNPQNWKDDKFYESPYV